MFSLLRCLLLPSPSIFVACAVEFQVGVLAPEDFSVSNLPLRGLTIWRSCVCCSVYMRNGLRFIDSKHCFADNEKTAFHECFGHWWEFEIAFSWMLPRSKNAPWRQTTVWRHGGHHRRCTSIRWELPVCSSLGPTRGSHTASALHTRRDYTLTSLGASRGKKGICKRETLCGL